MNKKLVLLFSLLLSNVLYSQQMLTDLALRPSEKLFVGVIENRKLQLGRLEQDRAAFIKKKQQADQEVAVLAEETKSQIDRLNKQVQEKKDDDFLKQELLLLNESYQVFKDIQRNGDKIVAVLDDFMNGLRSFLNDSNFAIFKREQKLSERLFYSFEDLQRLYNLILDQEKHVLLLTDQEKHLATELDNRERASKATQEAYNTKKSQIESGKLADGEMLDAQQTKELISIEERLYNYKKVLDSLLIKEMGYRIGLASLELSIAKSHLAIYKDYLRTIKPAVRVTEADIVHAREQLSQTTNKYRSIKEQYRSEIDRLVIFKDQAEKELQIVSTQLGVPVTREIDEWSKEAPQSVAGYLAYCEVGAMHEQLRTYQRKQQLLDVLISLEDEKLREETLSLQVKETYHKKFNTEEEIAAELKKYSAPRAESAAALSRYKERINVLADQLNVQKKTLDNINSLRQDIINKRETLFRTNAAEYNRCLALLKRAEAFEREQIDVLSKLTGVYSGLTSVINNKLRLVNFITGELESRTIWHRPEYAITLDGVKNIIPDIVNFLTYVRTYFTHLSLISVFSRIGASLKEPMSVLIVLMKLLLCACALFLLRRVLLPVNRWLITKGKTTSGLFQKIFLIFGVFTQFLDIYFVSIAIWAYSFIAVMLIDINDTYLYILFYLISIPYLIYLANRFIKYLSQFNKANGYVLLAEDFQRRFLFVFGFFLVATIVIQFFREAFMLAHYYRSELPTILLALNFIIFQVALILLIDKEQILGLIPSHNDLWHWIRDQIDRYYYLILLLIITIIVMSNPYVGFGRLVLYTLFGFLYSVILFMFLYWLHGIFKRGASRLYFVNVDDVARERFASAKTWFGITIIASFMFLSFFGFVIAAKIWGWPLTLSKIQEFFYYPIIGAGTDQQINLVSFSKIIAFIFIGVLLAYGINKFVLDRIFDLLLVDSGVQHTVTSITQYFIIIIAVFIGFHIANLGVLVNYIVGALILGVGWVLKEPIGDFVAYFIILVQRPVKIGDYIKVSKEIQGVVRKITARAVILRRKNSMTLVVPNSLLINRTIANWNYTRNFIAFDDIIVHVDYSEDPERVKEVLYKVVEQHPNILKNPKPWIRLDDFAEYGYEFMVRGFISSVYTLEKWEIASNIRINIIKAFQAENIKIALPTRVLLTRANKLGDGVGMAPGSRKE